MKFQVDLDKLRECLTYIKEVNDQELDNIEVFHNGKFHYVNPESIKEWKYVGLSNVMFLKHHFQNEL